MKSVFRSPVVVTVAVVILLAALGVALAPRWINAGAVHARIESAASSALGGTLTFERIDLSWLPRTEVAIRAVKLSVPGKASGSVRAVRASAALLPLLRGRVQLSTVGVDGLDLAVDLSAPAKKEEPAPHVDPDPMKGLRSLTAGKGLAVELKDSRIVLARPGHGSLAVEGARVEAAIRFAEGKSEVTLSRLSMESPRLLAEGTLRVDAAGPRVELAARGSNLVVKGVREKLLPFAGDDPVIAAIFGIVRGGTLTSFSFASAGKTPGELGVLERMSIHAAVKDARVRIDGPGLDLAGVSADVALEGGVLSAENATARVGKSRAFGGKVLVGLAPGDDRLRVETEVRADLTEVPAILARAIPGKSFREELALVEGLEGRATGRITIGDRAGDLNTGVTVSDLRFSANYRRLPWPLDVRAGRFSFDGKRVGVSGLEGSLGRSTFSGLAARVRLGKTPALEVTSGAIDVSLGDFLEGARSIRGAEPLARSIRRLSGSLHVGVRRVSGPLARLGEASLAASGTFKEILFDSSSPSLPPLSIASGGFSLSDDAIRVTDADVRTLDASLRVSGAWSGWRGGASTIDASTEGDLGPETIRWGWERASLPAEFRPAAPIALRGVRFALARGGALSVSGDLVVANGPRLTLDLTGDGKKIDVRNLTIADGDSTASMALLRPDAAFDVRFKGRLGGSTLAKLFGERKWTGGAIEGDVKALVPAENLGGLTAEGTLTATSLEVPTPAGPVAIERLDVQAAGSRFEVASSSFVLDEQRFSVVGGVTLRDGGVSLDLTSLAWRGFVFKPVLADVQFGKEALVTLRKADVCGISATGEARFLPGGAMAVDVRADSAGPDVGVPLTCFGVEDVGMTGGYEASVQVRGEGAASGLSRAVRGPLTFKATKGRIGKATLLTRILGVLNATDVFKGKTRTRVGDAIPYDRLTVSGELADGRFSIDEAAFVTPSITMAATGRVGFLDQSLDLMVLSHPLSTLDKIVQAVPIVRNILGRNFLAVAVKVTGTTGDPKVTVTPGRDVGKGLVGILERTVTLPVKVFDPPAPEGR